MSDLRTDGGKVRAFDPFTPEGVSIYPNRTGRIDSEWVEIVPGVEEKYYIDIAIANNGVKNGYVIDTGYVPTAWDDPYFALIKNNKEIIFYYNVYWNGSYYGENVLVNGEIGLHEAHANNTRKWSAEFYPLCKVRITNGFDGDITIDHPHKKLSFPTTIREGETKTFMWYAHTPDEFCGGFSIDSTSKSFYVNDYLNNLIPTVLVNGKHIIKDSASSIFVNRSSINIYDYDLRTFKYKFKVFAREREPNDFFYSNRSYVGNDLYRHTIYDIRDDDLMSFSPSISDEMMHGIIYSMDSNHVLYIDKAKGYPAKLTLVYKFLGKSYSIDLNDETGVGNKVYGVSGIEWNVDAIPTCEAVIHNEGSSTIVVSAPNGIVKRVYGNSSIRLKWEAQSDLETRGMIRISSGNSAPVSVYDGDGNLVDVVGKDPSSITVPYSPRELYVNGVTRKTKKKKKRLLKKCLYSCVMGNFAVVNRNVFLPYGTGYNGQVPDIHESSIVFGYSDKKRKTFKTSKEMIFSYIPWETGDGCVFVTDDKRMLFSCCYLSGAYPKQYSFPIDTDIGESVLFEGIRDSPYMYIDKNGEGEERVRSQWLIRYIPTCHSIIDNRSVYDIEVRDESNVIHLIKSGMKKDIEWSPTSEEGLYGNLSVRIVKNNPSLFLVRTAPKNTVVTITDQDGNPIYIGADGDGGNIPNDGWIHVDDIGEVTIVNTSEEGVGSSILCANDGSILFGVPNFPLFGKAVIYIPSDPLPPLLSVPVNVNWYTEHSPYNEEENRREEFYDPSAPSWGDPVSQKRFYNGNFSLSVAETDIVNAGEGGTFHGSVSKQLRCEIDGETEIVSFDIVWHYNSGWNEGDTYDSSPGYGYLYKIYKCVGSSPATSLSVHMEINTDKDQRISSVNCSRGSVETVTIKIDIKTHNILSVNVS